jgi:hypothetical protein
MQLTLRAASHDSAGRASARQPFAGSHMQGFDTLFGRNPPFSTNRRYA